MGLLITILLFLASLPQQAPQVNDVADRFNRAVELQRRGELKEAAAEYRAALARAPNYAEAQANLGAVLAQLGNYEEAIAAYQAAYRLKPELTPILLNLGIAHYRAGQFAKAVEVLGRFLAVAPDHAQARQLLGVSLVELGRDDEAVNYLEPALQSAQVEATALYSLGLAYLRLRRGDVGNVSKRLAAREGGDRIGGGGKALGGFAANQLPARTGLFQTRTIARGARTARTRAGSGPGRFPDSLLPRIALGKAERPRLRRPPH